MAPHGSSRKKPSVGRVCGEPLPRNSATPTKTPDSNVFFIDAAGPREKLPRPPSSLAPESVYAETLTSKKDAAPAAEKESDANVVETFEEDSPKKQASPAFLWPTCESVVVRSREVATSGPFPLAAICAPFSDGADSRSLELATPPGGAEGALRCPSCRCYANPFFRWCEKGTGAQHKTPNSFQCNMCRCQFDVPEGYLRGFNRPDPDVHPELFFGSVDISAPDHITVGTTSTSTEPATVFVLEQSKEAMEGGLHRTALVAIERAMDHSESQFRKRVCLITYCNTFVHFHSLNKKTGRFRRVMVRAADNDDEPFLPEAPASLMVDLRDGLFRDDFRELLQVMQTEAAEAEDRAEDSEEVSTASSSSSSSPSRSPSSRSLRRESARLQFRSSCALAGVALKLAVEVLEGVGGGDVMMFHATPPASRQEDQAIFSSNSTPSATKPNKWWRGASWRRGSSPVKAAEASCIPTQHTSQNENLLGRCTRAGVAVSVVTAPSAEVVEHMDIDSLQWLAWRTGGDVLNMPNFKSSKCEKQLCEYLHHWGGKMQGSAYSCVVRLRCSKGISCKKLLAPWSAAAGSADQSTFELPRMAADTSFAYELALEPEAKSENELPLRIDGKIVFYIQLATLYNDNTGRRLLRVHTRVIDTVPTVRSMFQFASVGPLMTYIVKKAAATALEEKSGLRLQSRDGMSDLLLKILVAYRRNCCGRDVSQNKMIAIDRRLRVLPLYVLGARKLIYSLTWNGTSGNEHLRGLLRMPVHSMLAAIYPRVYAVDDGTALPWPLASLRECLLTGSAPAFVITNGLGAWTYRRRDSQPRKGIEDGSVDVDAGRKIRAGADNICERLREVLEPAPRALGLSEIKSLSVATEVLKPEPARQTRRLTEIKSISDCAESAMAKSAQERREKNVFLATLFVEDEGDSELSYVGWLNYLQQQVRKILG
eukprot:TRINITY_DN5143_c0_g1_i6.p1 TRINITY_DN5143_c0_g1~~TRINITY_DN5143_c0_g1_i6.p1  ORF type:complete len:957 (+),score=175.14 TRINITY_DN5143_c0_g1_i6:58-2871(+)